MAAIRPKDLPRVTTVTAGDAVIIDGATPRSILVNNLIAPPPTSIGIAQSPYTPLDTDYLIYVDTSGGAVTINLKLAATRAGLPLSIKDATGNAVANNITINRSGAETIDGQVLRLIDWPYGGFRLGPGPARWLTLP